MDITTALRELGAGEGTLSEDECATLDRDGFLAIPGVLTADHLEGLRTRLDELVATEGARAGSEFGQEVGTTRFSDLINKGEVFDICYTHPKVLAAVAHVLGDDVKLSSLNARASHPGAGAQGLHADWSGPVADGDFQVCNSIWLIDDFTEDNGATRVVPGSHRFGRLPSEEEGGPDGRHPQEQLVLGAAGTVVVFNSHLWHGGTLNRTDVPRRALHSYFTRRSLPQQLDQAAYLRVRTADRLPAAARVVIDA
jgi:ectoine hydroxylase-related dioxygenase (phytanoyl-CoA dioxygenase family)